MVCLEAIMFIKNVQDYARPDIRPFIHAYPELRPDHSVHEVWHARKWLYDVSDHLLTPMVRIKNKDFYVNELVYCTNHTYFIPTRFYKKNDELWAFGHDVINAPVRIIPEHSQ